MGDKPSKESQDDLKQLLETAEKIIQEQNEQLNNLKQKLEAAEKKIQEMNDEKRKQEAIWRIDNLGNWDSAVKQRLLRDIKGQTKSLKSSSGKEIKFFRVIFVGPVGSGKSSLINAFNTALRGRVDNRAIEGGVDHTTKHFITYPAFDDDKNELLLQFCDVRGLGKAASGSTEVDILRAILGQKKEGEEFTPGKTYEQALDGTQMEDESAFMIVYVLDAAAYNNRKGAGEADPFISQILNIKDKTDSWPVGRALMLTHMDFIDPILSHNVKGIHQNAKVKKIFDEILNITKFPERCVFPIVNPVKFVQHIPDDFSVHLLYTLLSIVIDASDVYDQRALKC